MRIFVFLSVCSLFAYLQEGPAPLVPRKRKRLRCPLGWKEGDAGDHPLLDEGKCIKTYISCIQNEPDVDKNPVLP